jgi:hypothetical protein
MKVVGTCALDHGAHLLSAVLRHTGNSGNGLHCSSGEQFRSQSTLEVLMVLVDNELCDVILCRGVSSYQHF